MLLPATRLFNIFLSIVISCELTFELDYYLTAHNGIKYSLCTLITMSEGLGNSGRPAKNNNDQKK